MDPFNVTSIVPFQMRIFGHLILDELPDEALSEVLELLSNAWTFYAPASRQLEAPPKRVLKGKVTKRYERPAYSINEQE